MSGLESGVAAVRGAVAMPITSGIGHASGVDAWLGRRVGAFALDAGTPAAQAIDAFLPRDPAAFQYVDGTGLDHGAEPEE